MIERKLEPVGNSGNDIIYVCPNPRCDDVSGHLWVNYEKHKFHCWKCGFKGRRLESLMKFLGIDANYDYDKLYNEREDELDAIMSMNPSSNNEGLAVDYSTDLDVLTEYYKKHTKPLTPEAYEYLINDRGLTPDLISSLHLSEGVDRYGESFYIKGKECIGRDYSGRIMIPSLMRDGSVSFYLGRDYTGMKSNKYLNAPKEIAVASEDIWGLDTIDSSTVIIMEGVFSAIAVDKALGKHIACATYGKSIAHKSSDSYKRVTSQGEKLLNRGFNLYIVFYDKDALDEAYQNAIYLYERGANVRIVKIPKEMYGDHADAADMTPEEIKRLIRDSEPIDSFTSLKISLTIEGDTFL